MAEVYGFASKGDAQRVAKATLAAERTAPPDRGKSYAWTAATTRFLARLTDESDGAWKWEVVFIKPDGEYGTPSPAITSGSDFTAEPYNEGGGSEGDVVWLEYWGRGEDDKPRYRFTTGGGVSILYCKAAANFTPAGSGGVHTILATPCDSGGTPLEGATQINVRIHGNRTAARGTWYAAIKANDVLEYIPNKDGGGTLLPLPIIGGAVGSLMQTTGVGVVGFDFLRAWNIPTP